VSLKTPRLRTSQKLDLETYNRIGLVEPIETYSRIGLVEPIETCIRIGLVRT
jgi:hypothetical protein